MRVLVRDIQEPQCFWLNDQVGSPTTRVTVSAFTQITVESLIPKVWLLSPHVHPGVRFAV